MLKQVFFSFLFLSFAFSIVGGQCPELKSLCIQEACTKAGGELDSQGFCIKISGFDEARYQEELENCDYYYSYCVENDGVVRNMSCCGPVFILLPVLILALYADGTQ
ncbi:hypothetical protein GF412_03565 [Candidatus Micrarchaeota archaeon]|nr:hypothetical protein [Candidatus Micrarchaeota archaeon]MBD3418029.1 hypothetical protein [Candidatus Micrarchaeota archaeon]